MPKIFCQKCGAGNDYSQRRPISCGFCKTDFNQVTATQPKRRPIVEEFEYENEEETLEIADPLSHLEIQLDKKSQGFSFDQIVASGPSSPIKEVQQSPEESQKAFQKFQERMTASRRNGRLRPIQVDEHNPDA